MSQQIFASLTLLFLLVGSPATSEPGTRQSSRFSLRMNFDGAEALLAALEQRTVTDAEVDKLLAIRGVYAMVDNTTKYIPTDTRDTFRAAVKGFVTTRNSEIGRFRLDESFRKSAEIRGLIAKLEADTNLVAEVTQAISRYVPPIPHFTATMYGTTGGVSDGFVLDTEALPAFYVALNRAEGDVQGVKLQMAHEVYHVAQRLARASVPGLNAEVFDPKTAPPHARLLTVVLEEGTATYVSEPLLGREGSFFSRSSANMRTWRSSYKNNAQPKKIAANFAEFDRLLAGLRTGSMTWKQASDVVFTGLGPGPYFVGYEMAKAIDRHHGPARVASLQQQHPAAFFRTYIDLYRKSPGAAPARFSKETEAFIDSIPVR